MTCLEGEPNFATVAALTDVGENLMYLLGFVDVEMVSR